MPSIENTWLGQKPSQSEASSKYTDTLQVQSVSYRNILNGKVSLND